MKLKLHIIAGIALVATLITSCSNQKFAFRQKVKAGKHETVLVKKAKTVIRAEENNIIETATVTAAENPAVTASNINTEINVLHAAEQTVAAQRNVLLNADQKNQVKSGAGKQITKAASVAEKIKSDIARPEASVDSRKLIIVGLILILIGIVLSIALGWLGGLVATVGVILALIGLIFLLVDHV